MRCAQGLLALCTGITPDGEQRVYEIEDGTLAGIIQEMCSSLHPFIYAIIKLSFI